MELIALLIVIFLLVTFFLPWVNASRFRSLEKEIGNLQRDVSGLKKDVGSMVPGEVGEPVPEVQKAVDLRPEKMLLKDEAQEEESGQSEGGAVRYASASVPHIKASLEEETRGGFERNIGTKLPVWLGSISLIFSAFFLVKYSIESGWLGPVVRVSLGGAFGAVLLAAGQWVVRRGYLANSARIAQGLVGAGLVSLYVSLYAAINLYGLVPPLLGFAGMAVVTAIAVVMSLRHGQPIAAFGLLGGLLTPALVGSDEPNAIALFTYLFLLFSSMFYILSRKGWWILAVAALVGVYCWSIFWFAIAFAASDALILVLFAMAVTAVVLAFTGNHVRVREGRADALSDKRPVHALNFVAIAGGVLTIGWLSFEVTLSLFDWSMLGLLSLAMIGMAYFQPSIYQRPLWVKLGASLTLFGIWAQQVPLFEAVTVIAGFSLIYVGLSAFVMRQVRDPRFWGGVQCVAAVSLYIISYFVLDFPVWFTDPFARFWGMLSLVLASMTIWQAADIRMKYTANDAVQDHLVATYSLAATFFISLGIAIELPWEYVPLAFAGQIAATAWVYRKTDILFLTKIILLLTGVFLCMNYEQVLLFSDMVLNSLFDKTPSRSYLRRTILDVPVVKLGVPAALIALAAWVGARDREDKKFIHVMFGTTLFLVITTAYYLFRNILHDDYVVAFASQAGFLERGAITVALAVAGIGVLHVQERYDFDALRRWGRVLFHVAMARLVYFDLFLHNPMFDSGQFVGDWFLLNGVTLTYGGGALLVTWMIYSPYCEGGLRKFYKAFGFVLLFFFVSFTVRQYFHDGVLFATKARHYPGVYKAIRTSGSAELYSYSVAWLLAGLSLLTMGIRNRNITARIASLVFMILTVGKVFLFDAAALEGLYRVFSFLGLGMSLIGLSYFYTKFVFSKEEAGKKEVY